MKMLGCFGMMQIWELIFAV